LSIFQIAIDGPGGAGKSTIAKEVAKRLGIDYVDTGAMYRALGLKLLRTGTEIRLSEELLDLLYHTDIDFSDGRVYLDGEDVSGLIRNEEVSRAASLCSAIKEVRLKLVELQQAMGARKSIIMDGRDICAVVLKNARYKFFITADPRVRAERRYKEMLEKGEEKELTLEKVLADVEARDYYDTHRDVDPLRQAEDAELIDSTFMSVEDVVSYIIGKVKSD